MANGRATATWTSSTSEVDVRAELKRLHSPDAEDLRSFKPDDEADFALLVQAMVGMAGTRAEDAFDFVVCTPDWLRRRCVETRAPFFGANRSRGDRICHRAFVQHGRREGLGRDCIEAFSIWRVGVRRLSAVAEVIEPMWSKENDGRN